MYNDDRCKINELNLLCQDIR